ncbi:low-density lipoprotein receptor-related protein 12 [Neosynchiropus ocellatus]
MTPCPAFFSCSLVCRIIFVLAGCICVSAVPNACGEGGAELLRSPSGVITSPGWPLLYSPHLNCSWNIRGRPGDTVTISFQDFDLQRSHHCSADFLSISSDQDSVGVRLCGLSLPLPFTSSQNLVWIRFHSDNALTGKGFRLSYITGPAVSSVCEGDQFHCSNGKCIPAWWRCNKMDECGDDSDETECGSNAPQLSFQPCGRNQFPCLSRYTRVYTCLPQSLRCDGAIDCQDLGDEINCDVPACGERLKNFFGSFASPNYPDLYPPGSDCTWQIDTGDRRRVLLRFTDFKLDGTGAGDYVKVYDGLEENPRRLLRVLTAFDSRTTPVQVVSSSGRLRIHFYADKINAARGFNATYQVDGFCLPWEVPCGGSWGCYTEQQRCDGFWHCANGRDELNCSTCQPDEYPCSRSGACYPRSDRCNYQNRCPNGSDEKNCFFCQPGNFHCKNNRCVFESWVCDAQDDCGDGSDEEHCPVLVPTRVVTAAVIGSLVCGLLLVVALGCTCKLYSLRLFERRSFETQLSRVEAELLRREAPPSYGQLIAQGLIPPVEDFPVCTGSQASVLENLRLAVRSQLGFTSLRLPSSGRRGSSHTLWPRLFSRSRRPTPLALVSADLDNSSGSAPPSPDDTDSEAELLRERGGAVGGLPSKTLPIPESDVVPARSQLVPQAPPPSDVTTVDPQVQSTSSLQRLVQNLQRLARPWTRSAPDQNQPWPRLQPPEDLDDVELLIPDSAPSPVLEPRPPPSTGHVSRHRDDGGRCGGPCEHCGIVHTALIPESCRASGPKLEDDEQLLAC